MATSGDRSRKYDAQTSFELLWGLQEDASRGPKRRFTLDDIVTAAIEIADAEGVDAMSMRKVAEAIGYTTMSLYRYVPSKQHLLDLMVDRVSAETRLPDETIVGWRARIAHIARGDFAMMIAHPWMLVASQRPVLGPVAVQWIDAAIGALDETGMSPMEAFGVVMAVDSFVRGSARDLAESKSMERISGIAQGEWWEQQMALLERVFATHHYPAFQRFTEALSAEEGDEYELGADDMGLYMFEFGLELLLDGVEQYIAQRATEAK